jgi:hypothetical protein
MSVTVKFITEVAEIEFSDELWTEIENAASVSGMSIEDWIVAAIENQLSRALD